MLTDIDGLANNGGIICKVVGGYDAASSLDSLYNIRGDLSLVKNVRAMQRYPV